jgi:hypothetical protein
LLALIAGHTGADRLLDVQHAGEVGPTVLIHDRFGRADYPAKGLMTNVINSS